MKIGNKINLVFEMIMYEIWKFCIKKKFLLLIMEKLYVGVNLWIVKVIDLDGVM